MVSDPDPGLPAEQPGASLVGNRPEQGLATLAFVARMIPDEPQHLMGIAYKHRLVLRIFSWSLIHAVRPALRQAIFPRRRAGRRRRSGWRWAGPPTGRRCRG